MGFINLMLNLFLINKELNFINNLYVSIIMPFYFFNYTLNIMQLIFCYYDINYFIILTN